MEIIKGKILGAQKIVVYGPEGIGKSTFVSQFPNALFIDTEGSTKHMDVARTPKPSSWTMILEQVQYVKQNPTSFQTLVIDTADWAERLCIESICSENQKTGIEDFGYGKGYIYLVEKFGKLLNKLEELVEMGLNIVITAHAQMRKFEQPDEMGAYDRWELKLQKKTAQLIKEWADMVLFANYKTIVINVDDKGAKKGKNKAQGGQRVMYTTHHPCWDAKNRHNLALELPFEYSQIMHCLPGVEKPKETKPIQDEKTTYWHHPESGCVLELKPGESLGNGIDAGNCTELTEKEYKDLKNKYEIEKNVQDIKDEGFQQIKATDTELNQKPPKDTNSNPYPSIPKSLSDLMLANEVTVEEIQEVVAKKGYYPQGTPISKYDPQFVDGVLVGAWEQVLVMITDERVPF